jgi:hypothetical protein
LELPYPRRVFSLAVTERVACCADKGVVTVAGRGDVLVVRGTSMRKELTRGASALNCYTARRCNMEDVGTGRAGINEGLGPFGGSPTGVLPMKTSFLYSAFGNA